LQSAPPSYFASAFQNNGGMDYHRVLSSMQPALDRRSECAADRNVPELSVVMPCLNEAETLRACIAEAREGLEACGLRGEIVVADNGSTDGSPAVAAECGARVVSVAEKGYGNALQGGIAAARGAYILMGDADDSYDFSKMELFIERLRLGEDLVMGNRFRGGIAENAMPFLHRYLGNPVLTWLARLFFKTPTGDINCGLRAFRKDAYEKMQLRSPGMEFATEMVVRAAVLGMKISEVPTRLFPDGRSRPPHLRTWRDGWRTLRFFLLYSPRWLFLYPGLALMLAGLAATAWLIRGPQRLGSVTFDVDTLVYAVISILLGFQIMSIALFAKVFAISEGLLPEDRKVQRFFSYVSLENGLFTGIMIFLAGLGLSVLAVAKWKASHFGNLDPSQMLRLTLPAAAAATLGLQIATSSFFLGLLRMRKK
jgi:glycosyltransferase involved in cell wall biosynthesis